MNYVPLVFMDSVAATLRHLPTSEELDTVEAHDDFVKWKHAMKQVKRTVYTMEITENSENSYLRITLSPIASRGKLWTENFYAFKKQDNSKIQIHKICVNSGDIGFIDSSGTIVFLENEFQEIIDSISPLTNCASLIISGAIAKERPVFNYLPMLSGCSFREIRSTKMCPTLGEDFMTKQLKTGILAKISTWPTQWSTEFKLAVEEFLTTQSFEEVKLPNSFPVSKELYEKLLKTSFASKKKISFQTNFEVPHQVGVVLLRGETNERIFIELLNPHKEVRRYAMTTFSDCMS